MGEEIPGDDNEPISKGLLLGGSGCRPDEILKGLLFLGRDVDKLDPHAEMKLGPPGNTVVPEDPGFQGERTAVPGGRQVEKKRRCPFHIIVPHEVVTVDHGLADFQAGSLGREVHQKPRYLPGQGFLFDGIIDMELDIDGRGIARQAAAFQRGFFCHGGFSTLEIFFSYLSGPE
jgi:hypothetical protein